MVKQRYCNSFKKKKKASSFCLILARGRGRPIAGIYSTYMTYFNHSNYCITLISLVGLTTKIKLQTLSTTSIRFCIHYANMATLAMVKGRHIPATHTPLPFQHRKASCISDIPVQLCHSPSAMEVTWQSHDNQVCIVTTLLTSYLKLVKLWYTLQFLL